MAIFDNNLKPEEEFGAFIPGSQDDDSFYLEKLDSYNGVLPDFSVEETAISDLILEQLDPEAISKRNVRNDAKKHDDFGANYTPNVIPEKIIPEDDPPQDYDNLTNYVKEELHEGDSNSEPKWGDDYIGSSPEENNFEEDEELNFASAIPKASSNDGLVDFDLKALLQSELDRSKERNANKPVVDDGFNSSSSDNSRGSGGAYVSPFGEVASFEEHPEVLAFDNIHGDSPSTYGLKEITDAEKEDEKNNNDPKKSKKEKKKRKPMPLWQIISIASAAVLVIGALIAFGLFKFVTDPTFMRFARSKSDTIQVSSKEKPKSKKSKEIKVVESTPTEKVVEKEAPKEVASNEPVEDKTNNETIKEEPRKDDSKKIEIAEPTKKITLKEIPSKKKDIQTPQFDKKVVEKRQKEPKVNRNKSTKENVSTEKTENVAKNITPKKEVKAKINEVADDEDNIKPSFAVQIYATPSKDDAEDWVKRLKQKSAKNVRIDSQMIRDVKWFRVRFGDFENKEDAKLAALKLGFAQSWIDRVR
ncbi:MAG: SPOR domain-containing protein [Candidatus Kapabacteria bacterium]|nr:SPOR domain-containing protein [Candidatus Kapabacteria bacterium]